MIVVRQTSRILQQAGRRLYHDSHFKPPTMDELPVPKGSWQAQYDANQRRYNGALIFGIAFAVGTIAIAKTTGLVYFNWAPPKTID